MNSIVMLTHVYSFNYVFKLIIRFESNSYFPFFLAQRFYAHTLPGRNYADSIFCSKNSTGVLSLCYIEVLKNSIYSFPYFVNYCIYKFKYKHI